MLTVQVLLTYNHYHSGIRFFYKKVLKMNWDDDDIPRMKRDRSLPIVLTKAEIHSKNGSWIRIQLFGNSEQLQMMEKRKAHAVKLSILIWL